MTQEPVAINVALGGVLSTGVALAALLIPGLSTEIQVATVAFGNAVILLGVVLLTRAQVTPVAAPTLPAGTEVKIQNTEPQQTTTV
jgi:hypothetical protein